MEKTPVENYLDLMSVVRGRFDTLDSLLKSPVDDYARSEIAAFHCRKIIEAIAFGCLVAVKNGSIVIPNDAVGQYNAEKILKTLIRKKVDILQSPSIIRNVTEEEKIRMNVKAVVEGIPENRITSAELIKKYQRTHNWLHELNPYTKEEQPEFHRKHSDQLWIDIQQLKAFLQRHFVSINRQGFFCVLEDSIDSQTKVLPLSKIEELNNELGSEGRGIA